MSTATGQLESRLLTLVTLGLVAFGLVMVYSATSAPAALGDGDPGYYLKKQGVYALAGLVLLVVASRTPYRMLRRHATELFELAGVEGHDLDELTGAAAQSNGHAPGMYTQEVGS